MRHSVHVEDQSEATYWAAVVEAQRSLVAAQSAFRNSTSRQVLRQALTGPGSSGWDGTAALAYLADLSDEVPELVDELVQLAMSPRSAGRARRALAAGPRQVVRGRVEELARSSLPEVSEDDFDLRRWAEVLECVGSWAGLAELVRIAAASGNPDAQEVAEDVVAQWGPMLDSLES